MKHRISECLFYSTETSTSLPLMDVYETAEFLVFEIDLPGVNIGDVSVKVYDDIVIIEGVKKQELKTKHCKFLCMERCFDNFRRMVKIPVKVNVDDGRARYADGVVTLVLPKVKNRVFNIKIEKE